MAEVWKPVAGFEGLYEVSDEGRIRSVARDVRGRWGVFTKAARPLATFADSDGYQRVNLWRGKKMVQRPVHQLVLEAFIGPRPEGCMSLHGDGRRDHNRLTNLRWGTAADNARDRDAAGLGPQGERNPRAKLTAESARCIRRDRRTAARIAMEHGVCVATVHSIRNGHTWKEAN